MEEPEGFSNLTGERTILVDVYFGGLRRGEAQITVLPGSVTIVDPHAVTHLLPGLTDRNLVEGALGADSLPANSELVCAQSSDRRMCGRLLPSTVGVIFDREKFRLDVFLNPKLLAVKENIEERYLPEAKGGPSLVNSIGAVLSGGSGLGGDYYNIFDQLVLADGERRFRAEAGFATDVGLEADRLVFEWDRPGLRYSAGALWAPGSEIGGRRKLIGLGLESQIDTRLDKDTILGSPIVVYLDQRARVDVVRDGRVLNSAIYEAGNQQIDTSNLPDGSYAIVLRIVEPGRQAREERRFFSKSRRIPSLGRTDFFVFGGLLIDDRERGSLKPSNTPYLQGGVVHRLSQGWAVAGDMEATSEGASAEFSATLLGSIAQVRAAAVADLNGAYGGILQLTSTGTSRLNFNFDLRRIVHSAQAEALATPGEVPTMPENLFGVADRDRSGGSYSQLGGLVAYSLANMRFLGTAFYRKDESQELSYSVGPALEWDVLRKGQLTLTLRSEMAITERGKSGFAGISLRVLGPNASLSALSGARASSIAGDDRGQGAVAAIAGSWSRSIVGGELALGVGFEHQPRDDNATVSGEFRHPLGSLSGDFVHTDGPESAATQYSVGLQTTIVAGAGAVQFAGRTSTESMIIAQVKEAHEGDTFDVLVNERLAGSIAGARPLTLALPAYHNYEVRIRPTGDRLVAYDSSSRNVALYPGAVTRLNWGSAPISIMIGRLITSDGTPERGASITGPGIWSETDDEGYFQIEATDHAKLTVSLGDGSSFSSTLPVGQLSAGVVRLGTVVCCERNDPKLGALDFPNQLEIREPQ